MICFAVFSSLAEKGRTTNDPERVRHATSAARYFLDKIVSREPKLDVARAMAQLAAEIGHQPLSDYQPGCIEERQRGLETIINSQKRGSK